MLKTPLDPNSNAPEHYNVDHFILNVQNQKATYQYYLNGIDQNARKVGPDTMELLNKKIAYLKVIQEKHSRLFMDDPQLAAFDDRQVPQAVQRKLTKAKEADTTIANIQLKAKNLGTLNFFYSEDNFSRPNMRIFGESLESLFVERLSKPSDFTALPTAKPLAGSRLFPGYHIMKSQVWRDKKTSTGIDRLMDVLIVKVSSSLSSKLFACVFDFHPEADRRSIEYGIYITLRETYYLDVETYWSPTSTMPKVAEVLFFNLVNYRENNGFHQYWRVVAGGLSLYMSKLIEEATSDIKNIIEQASAERVPTNDCVTLTLENIEKGSQAMALRASRKVAAYVEEVVKGLAFEAEEEAYGPGILYHRIKMNVYVDGAIENVQSLSSDDSLCTDDMEAADKYLREALYNNQDFMEKVVLTNKERSNPTEYLFENAAASTREPEVTYVVTRRNSRPAHLMPLVFELTPATDTRGESMPAGFYGEEHPCLEAVHGTSKRWRVETTDWKKAELPNVFMHHTKAGTFRDYKFDLCEELYRHLPLLNQIR
eukprot:Platyproteum_vivax@DN6556_c0_g1_i1.p1